MIFDHFSGRLSALDEVVVASVPPGGNWRNLPPDFPSARIRQIRDGAAAGGGSRSTYYGRLQWDRPSYTISTFFSRPGNGCFIHPEAPRLITVREAARFQSFPDSYRFYGRGRARFLQVGNAVPPLLAYQLASCLPAGQVVDLFCGAGGLSLGLELANLPMLAAVEYDEAAIRTFNENRPDFDGAIQADLSDSQERRVVIKEIRRRAGSDGVAVLAGGPPCQGFSTAGNCDLSDRRNQLVYAFLDVAAELKPTAVVMENVAALLFKRRVGVLNEIRSSLHRLGYVTDLLLAHAEGYGVPQLRRRLILVARKEGADRAWPAPWRQIVPPSQVQFQPRPELTVAAPLSVREAISDLPVQTVDDPDSPIPYASEPLGGYQEWARGIATLDAIIPPTTFTEPQPQLP